MLTHYRIVESLKQSELLTLYTECYTSMELNIDFVY